MAAQNEIDAANTEADGTAAQIVDILNEKHASVERPLRAAAQRRPDGCWLIVGLRSCCPECAAGRWCAGCGDVPAGELGVRVIRSDTDCVLPVFILFCTACADLTRKGQAIDEAIHAGLN